MQKGVRQLKHRYASLSSSRTTSKPYKNNTQNERLKMALALSVSLDNDTLFTLLTQIDKTLTRQLPDYHFGALQEYRKVIIAELDIRGIYTA
jgi:hypothetical protein